MKSKGKGDRAGTISNSEERGKIARLRSWRWLAAVLLTVAFLAAECVSLLP